MKTTVEALKDLYVELGGDADDVQNIVTIPDIIESIAALIKSGATKELPAVESTDNGSVLTVVEGAWAKATPAKELPAVTADDNGDVLTVVEGAWTNAAPSGGGTT